MLSEKDQIEAYICIQKKQFYKLVQYGINFTNDDIEEMEKEFSQLTGEDKSFGLMELYNLAKSERLLLQHKE